MKKQYYDIDCLLTGKTVIDGKKYDVTVTYELPNPEFVDIPDNINEKEETDYITKFSKWSLKNMIPKYNNGILDSFIVTWTNASDNKRISTNLFDMPKGSYSLFVGYHPTGNWVVDADTTPIDLTKIKSMYESGIFKENEDRNEEFGMCFVAENNLRNEDYLKWLDKAQGSADIIPKEQFVIDIENEDLFDKVYNPYKHYLFQYLTENVDKLKQIQKDGNPITIKVPFPHVNKKEFDSNDAFAIEQGNIHEKVYPKELKLDVLPKKYQNSMVSEFWENTAVINGDEDDTFANPYRMTMTIANQIGGFSVLRKIPNYSEREEHDDYDILSIRIPSDRIKWIDDNYDEDCFVDYLLDYAEESLGSKEIKSQVGKINIKVPFIHVNSESKLLTNKRMYPQLVSMSLLPRSFNKDYVFEFLNKSKALKNNFRNLQRMIDVSKRLLEKYGKGNSESLDYKITEHQNYDLLELNLPYSVLAKVKAERVELLKQMSNADIDFIELLFDAISSVNRAMIESANKIVIEGQDQTDNFERLKMFETLLYIIWEKCDDGKIPEPNEKRFIDDMLTKNFDEYLNGLYMYSNEDMLIGKVNFMEKILDIADERLANTKES